jgi:hypothetical protein
MPSKFLGRLGLQRSSSHGGFHDTTGLRAVATYSSIVGKVAQPRKSATVMVEGGHPTISALLEISVW